MRPLLDLEPADGPHASLSIGTHDHGFAVRHRAPVVEQSCAAGSLEVLLAAAAWTEFQEFTPFPEALPVVVPDLRALTAG